ncbi:gas vesicle protein GvpC, partial [Streptosporangium sandarakinum]
MTGYFRSVLSHHVNQASVSSKVLMQTSVPLPPSNEQQRIVATLDFYLSRLDEGLKGVVESKGRLRVLVSVLLAQALQGNYHGIDRDAVLPTRWEWVSIGDIADVGTGMTPLRSRQDYYADGTVPWVTSTLVNKPFIGEVKQYVTEKALVETSLKIWPKGTIVVAMYGEGQTRGRSSEMLIDATMNQACAAIVLKPQYENRRPWVKLALEANYERMRRLASGGVQPNLNLSLVRGIRIPLPPKEEQDRILSDVDEARSRQMRLGQALAAAEIRGKALRRALLTEAFAGRLVPQDPADEPASELLARIKAERAAQAKPQHARRTKSARPSVTGPTGSPVAPLTESQPAGRTEWPDVSCTPTTYEQGELL